MRRGQMRDGRRSERPSPMVPWRDRKPTSEAHEPENKQAGQPVAAANGAQPAQTWKLAQYKRGMCVLAWSPAVQQQLQLRQDDLETTL